MVPYPSGNKYSSAVSRKKRRYTMRRCQLQMQKSNKLVSLRLNFVLSNLTFGLVGQIYEKKAKKRASDANEEHARYINLINTLGPEISQDK
jgi:ATP/ADP translocase